MLARDLMRREVLTVREDDLVSELVDTLMGEHIHGAPVTNAEGRLVGVVSQQDVFFSRMTRGEAAEGTAGPNGLRVGEIMTAPAVFVDETTAVTAVCRMMFRLRIHRVPVVREGQLTGMISSLDVCGAIAEGKQIG